MKTEAIAHLSLNYTRAILAEHRWELWVYTSFSFGVSNTNSKCLINDWLPEAGGEE